MVATGDILNSIPAEVSERFNLGEQPWFAKLVEGKEQAEQDVARIQAETAAKIEGFRARMEEVGGLASIGMSGNDLEIDNFAQLLAFAHELKKGDIAPPSLDTPQKIALAMAFGHGVGLGWLPSLQHVCVVNGKPSIYGPAMMALAMRSPQWGGTTERWTLGGKEIRQQDIPHFTYSDRKATEAASSLRAHCEVVVVRGNREETFEDSFSLGDAVRAGLFGPSMNARKPWAGYPLRMLQWRARSVYHRAFADVFLGASIVEATGDGTAGEFGEEDDSGLQSEAASVFGRPPVDPEPAAKPSDPAKTEAEPEPPAKPAKKKGRGRPSQREKFATGIAQAARDRDGVALDRLAIAVAQWGDLRSNNKKPAEELLETINQQRNLIAEVQDDPEPAPAPEPEPQPAEEAAQPQLFDDEGVPETVGVPSDDSLYERFFELAGDTAHATLDPDKVVEAAKKREPADQLDYVAHTVGVVNRGNDVDPALKLDPSA